MLFLLGILALEGALAWLIWFIVDAKGFGDIIKQETWVFYVVSMILMIIWIGIMIAYLAWAIYFYNINHGLTNEDWALIKIKKRFDQIPKGNPHMGETLGLPNGTVRGLIAITLLVGGFAMMIASLGKSNEHDVNKIFVDNLDFFKTGFLMMIAFYFGNKALTYLKPNVQTLKNVGAKRGRKLDDENTESRQERVDASELKNKVSGKDFDEAGSVG